MSLIKKYLKLRDEYVTKYGKKTILYMQVGAFFEVYTKVDSETRTITDQRVIDFQSYNKNIKN